MAISRNKKADILSELEKHLKESKSVFFTSYRGLSVSDLSAYRAELKSQSAPLVVAKKSLARHAASKTLNLEIPDESLPGPVAFVFSKEDEITPAKTIAKWAKAHKKSVSLVGGIFEGRLLTQEEAISISTIPSREELLAKLVGSLSSPISGFVRSLKSPLSGFTNVLREISKQGN